MFFGIIFREVNYKVGLFIRLSCGDLVFVEERKGLGFRVV